MKRLALFTALSLSVPILATPANAETYRISRDYKGPICVQTDVNKTGVLNIQWGSWNTSVDIRQAQASARGPAPSLSAGGRSIAGSALLLIASSYKAYQLLVDSTSFAHIQFEARGNNVETINITGARHRLWTGQCGIGVSVNSIIRL